ncbi:MAG: hypothetical protein IJ774_07055 [Selenomonadaceae bacterium]|nr:hypothetical protein [Selenomonadaceae bacterium]
MATREENLKKINTELNKLSDDELDKIAGGNAAAIASTVVEIGTKVVPVIIENKDEIAETAEKVAEQIGFVSKPNDAVGSYDLKSQKIHPGISSGGTGQRVGNYDLNKYVLKK